MRRSSSILIGLVAAAATFGSLTAFVGPRHFGYRGYNSYNDYRDHDGYRCDDSRYRDGQKDNNDLRNQKTKPADSTR